MCWREAIRTQLFNFQGTHLQKPLKTCFCLRNCNNCVSDCTVGSAERWTKRIEMRRNARWATKASSLHMTTCSSEKWRALQGGQLRSNIVCSRLFPPTCLFLVNLQADFWREVEGQPHVLEKVLKNRKSLFTSALQSINRIITEQQASLKSQTQLKM